MVSGKKKEGNSGGGRKKKKGVLSKPSERRGGNPNQWAEARKQTRGNRIKLSMSGWGRQGRVLT